MKKKPENTMQIQTRITERAVELLNLNGSSKLLLDIGCGSGLSGEVISNHGHRWFGVDISRAMLDVALERGIEGDLFQWDFGDGLTFRPGTFDGAISISAIQWLCNADKSSHNPIARIRRFFETLYCCLIRGGRAVLQAYPQDSHQMDLLATAAARAGFGGGWLIDYPNSARAKKYYLVLFAGIKLDKMPMALGQNGSGIDPISQSHDQGGATIETSRQTNHAHSKQRNRDGKIIKKSKEWIQAKKDRQRRQGREVRPDSKYTGRKRKIKAC